MNMPYGSGETEDSEQINNKIIVVLGMYRGGTSAIIRALTVLGVDSGNRRIAPKPDNPRGFWEDADILDLNETLLSAFGRNHLSISPILVDWQGEIDRQTAMLALPEFVGVAQLMAVIEGDNSLIVEKARNADGQVENA